VDCVHAAFSHKERRKVALHAPGRDDDIVCFVAITLSSRRNRAIGPEL